MVTNGSTSLAQRNDLGVGRRIGGGDVAIPSSADDTAIAYNDCSYRNFPGLERSLGAPQGFLHPKLVGRFIGTRFIREGYLSSRRSSRLFSLRMGCSLWRHEIESPLSILAGLRAA